MKKFLLTTALVLLAGVTMAQNTIDLTFSRNNSIAGTDATVTVGNTGDIDVTGITSTIACNYNWKAFGANSNTFPNSSILCPDKNTKDMTGDAAGVITLTLAGVPENYQFNKFTFTSVALNGGGAFQGDNANAQHVDFILKQDDATIAVQEDIAIKVNSNGGESVTVVLTPKEAIKAVDGTVTLYLNIVNNYAANGCFYGLFKVAIETEVVAPEPEPEPEPEPSTALYHLSGKNLKASELMAKTEPTYIAIKGLAQGNNVYYNYITNATNTSQEFNDQTNVFIWEPVTVGTAGSYYLRKLDAGYMQATAPGDFADSKETAAVFTAVKPTEVASGANGNGEFNKDANSNGYIAAAGGYDYIVRFVKGDKWLNIGAHVASAQKPAYNNGYGTYTIYQICELVECAPFNITIKNTGNIDYATFYSNAPVELPEGVTAYYVKEDGIKNGYITLTEDGDGIIAGNTGVILATTADADAEVAITVRGANVAAENDNLLKGSVDNTYVEGEAYVLFNHEVDGIGFYKAELNKNDEGKEGTTHFLNYAGKAYLPASALGSASNIQFYGFRFDDEETTAIENVEVVTEDVIFDLSGRRVSEITEKGIYIVNGRKILVK